MAWLYAVAGLGVGVLVNWAAGRLPRLAAGSLMAARRPGEGRVPAIWYLLWSLVSRQGGSLTLYGGVAAAAEIASALFAVLVAQSPYTLWQRSIVMLAYAFLLLVALIDLRYRMILNVMVLPAAAAALLGHLVLGGDVVRSLLGGAIGLSPFLLLALLKPGSLGGGDVKLAALIGLSAGFPHVLWPLSLGILAGALCSVLLLVVARRDRSSHIPYGPFLCLGAIVSLLYNPLALLFSL